MKVGSLLLYTNRIELGLKLKYLWAQVDSSFKLISRRHPRWLHGIPISHIMQVMPVWNYTRSGNKI